MGLTLDALRQRSDAGREGQSGGERRRSLAQGDSLGNRLRGSCYEGSGCPTTSTQSSAWEKDAAGLRASSVEVRGRKLRDVKRPACSERQTGACRRCGPAACQPCRGREEPVGATDLSTRGRRTPTDQVKTKRSERSVPRVQRMRRSTPTVRRLPNGRSDQPRPSGGCPAGEGLITPTAGLDRGRRTSVNSVVSARAASCGELGQVRFGSIPSWATGGERIILRSDPCNRDRAPRFLWSETLVKSLTVQSLSPFPAPQKRACKTPQANCRQIVH